MAVSFLAASEFGSPDEIAALYTETFAEYYTDGKLVEVEITADMLKTFIAHDQISLDLSPVMLVDGVPAGLTTIGVRSDGRASYCRGFGVVPAFRGRGLGVALADEMVRRALEDGGAKTGTHMTLSCMADNTSAIATYRRAGFADARKLQNLQWDASCQDLNPVNSNVVTVAPATLLGLSGGTDSESAHQLLHPSSPVWPRDVESLRSFEDLLAFAVPGDAGGYTAYALAQPISGRVGGMGSPIAEGATAAAIVDLAGSSRESIETVVAALQAQFTSLSIGGEPVLERPSREEQESYVLPVLLQCGFQVVYHRLEMTRSLHSVAHKL